MCSAILGELLTRWLSLLFGPDAIMDGLQVAREATDLTAAGSLSQHAQVESTAVLYEDRRKGRSSSEICKVDGGRVSSTINRRSHLLSDGATQSNRSMKIWGTPGAAKGKLDSEPTGIIPQSIDGPVRARTKDASEAGTKIERIGGLPNVQTQPNHPSSTPSLDNTKTEIRDTNPGRASPAALNDVHKPLVDAALQERSQLRCDRESHLLRTQVDTLTEEVCTAPNFFIFDEVEATRRI
eukprot:scaffold4387_cov400-Prasinococcus_capsulatus_cf.AAC.9